eukprot:jgi/Picsp_1/4338/NSC_01845-R1_insulin-degrading enzyme-like
MNSPCVRVSPADKRIYKSLELKNGLKVLIIHDKEIKSSNETNDLAEGDLSEEIELHSCSEHSDDGSKDSDGGSESSSDDEPDKTFGKKSNGTKRTAAALSVGIGHYSDPQDIPGLSHYLEHMLFMGSKKFPDENEYDAFLNKHNGSSNAYTEEETTTFYFDCSPEALRPMLDRFSQFFISPLLKSEALEREVIAIDNEFADVNQNDSCRLAQARAICAKPDHPAAKFSWGNKKSLFDIPVSREVDMQAELLHHFECNFKAERMTLVVIAGEEVATLESWISELFSLVPRGNDLPLKFDAYGFPFEEEFTMSIIPSVCDEHKIGILFQLPSSLQKEYLKKSEDYVSHLVGHEGKGSLFDLLKRREWATELCAGIIEQTSAAWLFEVSITLTELGMNAFPGCGLAVVEAVFEYLSFLKSSEPVEWIWREMARISEMKWLHVEEEDPAEYVSQISVDMQTFPMEHVFYWSYMYEVYDANLIKWVLSFMDPCKARIDLQTIKYEEQVKVFKSLNPYNIEEKMESWFDFCFVSGTFDSQNLIFSKANTFEFELPSPNPYIPETFKLEKHSNLPVESMDLPLKVNWRTCSPDSKAFLKIDRKFLAPKLCCFFRLHSPIAYRSPREVAMTHMVMKILEDVLCKESYLADMAGLHYTIWMDGSSGLDFRVEGFSDKLDRLSSLIFSSLANLKFRNMDFDRVKEVVQRHYHNALLKPSKHAQFLRIQTLKSCQWDPREIYTELQNIHPDDIRVFQTALLKNIHLTALFVGNCSVERSAKIIQDVGESISDLSDGPIPDITVLEVKENKTVLRWEKTINPSEENSSLEYYLQLGYARSSTERCFVDMIEQLIYEPCYDTLRTKEQLGYIVSSGARLTGGIQGLCITIQSRTQPCHYLESRVEIFLEDFGRKLREMEEDEFETNKKSLLDSKRVKDRNIAEEAERLWDALVNRGGEFNYKQADIEALSHVSKDDIVQYYNEFILPSSLSRRKLVVYVDPVSRYDMDDKASCTRSSLLLKEALEKFHAQETFYHCPF